MRIEQTIIIPAMLALGIAGSVLVGSGIFAPASHVSATHVQATASSASPGLLYHN